MRTASRAEAHVVWSFYGAAIAVVAALSLLLADSSAAVTIFHVAYLLTGLLAVVLLARVVAVVSGAERRQWRFLLVGFGLLLLGDLVWSWQELSVVQALPDLASPAAVLYGAAAVPLVLYAGSLLATALSGSPSLTRFRYALDLAVVTLLVGTAFMILVVYPVSVRIAGSLEVSWIVGMALTGAGVLVFATLLTVLLESDMPLWARWESKVTAALGLLLASGVAASIFDLRGLLTNVSAASVVVDSAWMFAYYMILRAAAQRLGTASRMVRPPMLVHARRGVPRWYDYAVAGLLVALVPFVLYEARFGRLGVLQFWTLAGAASLLAVLVIIRSVVLTSENGQLLSHTVVDPLTGAYNHRFLHDRIRDEIARASRTGECVTLALMDVDDFSLTNERHGHARGDRCLRRIADILRTAESGADVVCRVGGDEFAIVMPGADTLAALSRIESLQQRIRDDDQLDGCSGSVSVGIATYPEHATERTALVSKADGALYWAQASGPGTVVVYDDDVAGEMTPDERLRLAQEQSYMTTVESLAAAVDARDPYTQHHSRNVAELAQQFGRSLGLAESRTELLAIAGLLHDVGKIGVPDSILRKPGMLTAEERLKIEEHPALGERILSATVFKEILPWVLSHHERWDGTGYPQGLSGDAIPKEARVLALCDAFDAMVSDRPYRTAMPVAEALRVIEGGSGTQFDPFLAPHFIEMISDMGLESPETASSPRLQRGHSVGLPGNPG